MKKPPLHRAVMLGCYVLMAVPAILIHTFIGFLRSVSEYIIICVDDWNE